MKNLILLHGALGSKAELIPLKEALKASYQVHTLEFDGHGTTLVQVGFSIPVFAQNLKTFILDNHLIGADIFGFSMGGYVGLYLAAQNPDLLGRIITLGTKFNWNQETAETESKKLNPEKIEEKVPKFARYLASLHGDTFWKTNVQLTATLMRTLGNDNLLESHFSHIQNNCFIGLGSLDTLVSLEETEHAIEQLPHAQFYSLANTPHPISQVDTLLLAKKISELLND
jgi:pimeloyl-ACP methyl ester carboxylesterase